MSIISKNQLVKPSFSSLTPVVRPKPIKAKTSRYDYEFLPGALEILETPASPVATSFIGIICVFAVVTLTWAYFSKIDVFAIASGKIQPAGQIKIIQPLEAGRIKLLMAENGQHVDSGEILVGLETAEAESDVKAARDEVASYDAETSRRQFVLGTLLGLTPAQTLATLQQMMKGTISISWAPTVPNVFRAREDLVMKDDLSWFYSRLTSLEAQRTQKLISGKGLASTIEAQKRLIATLTQRVEMRTQLASMNADTKTNVLDATERLQSQQTELTTQQSEVDSALSDVQVLEAEEGKSVGEFKSGYSQKIAELGRQLDDSHQKLAKAETRLDHLSLRSPISGTIQNLAISTIGQVVNGGQELMRIVPDEANLEVVAYVENKDIGFVKLGQRVVVKVESFPSTRYGTLGGTVTHIAKDSVPSADAQRSEGDPTQAPNAGSFFETNKSTQNLVYAVTVSLERTYIPIDGARVPLSSGMTVSAEMATGSRRIIEYFLSPFFEVAGGAMFER